MSIEKSTKAARGTVQCENTNINLLKANDFVADIIKNVGNLVCPSSFDLGEDYRVTLMATTEGDDKPKKYPKMFLTSDMMLVSKADLLPYVPFSVEAVTKDAHEVNHELEVIQISSLSEEGVDEWCDWLLEKIQQKKG